MCKPISVSTSSAPAKRAYDSSRRRALAELTRAEVFAAAHDLFSRNGWAGTGMRDVARQAGVSVETVYSVAGSKLDLLTRVIDISAVGDDDAASLAERAEFRAMGEGSRRARLEAAARLVTVQFTRGAALLRTLDQAATGNAELTAKRRELRTRMRQSADDALALVLGHAPSEQIVDAIWALGSPDVFLLLVETADWSPEKYQEAMAQWFGALLAEYHPDTDPEEPS